MSQRQASRYKRFFPRPVETLDAILQSGGNAPLPDRLLENEAERPFAAQVFGAAPAGLVLAKPPPNIEGYPCVQAVIGTADNIEAVDAIVHFAG